MASDECGNPDYAWTVASAKAKKGIYLVSTGPNEEILEVTVEELKKYEGYWVDVIYVYVEAY